MKSLRGLDLRMASSICSSSRQRALKPDRGWLLRQMAAWEEAGGTQFQSRMFAFSRRYFEGVIMCCNINENRTFCGNLNDKDFTGIFLPLHALFKNTSPNNFSYLHRAATWELTRDLCMILPSSPWTTVEPLCTNWAPHTGPQALGSWPQTHKALPTVQARINRRDYECSAFSQFSFGNGWDSCFDLMTII